MNQVHFAIMKSVRLFFFAFIVAAGCSVLVSNNIASPNLASGKLIRAEIISCDPNSFYNEPFDPSLEKVQIRAQRKILNLHRIRWAIITFK